MTARPHRRVLLVGVTATLGALTAVGAGATMSPVAWFASAVAALGLGVAVLADPVRGLLLSATSAAAVAALTNQSGWGIPLALAAFGIVPALAVVSIPGGNAFAQRLAIVGGSLAGPVAAVCDDPFRRLECIGCEPNPAAIVVAPFVADVLRVSGLLMVGVAALLVVASAVARRAIVVASGAAAASVAALIALFPSEEVHELAIATALIGAGTAALPAVAAGTRIRRLRTDFARTGNLSPVPEGASARTRIGMESQRLGAELEKQIALIASTGRAAIERADGARAMLERDVHDGGQQYIIALALAVRHARATEEIDAATEASITELIERALDALRDISHRASPPLLASGRLAAAIRALPQSVVLDGDPSLEPHLKRTVYLVVETLAVRGSRVHFTTTDEAFEVVIDPSAAEVPPLLEHRVAIAGGRLTTDGPRTSVEFACA